MTDTTRAALAQALDALRGAGIVMMRSIAAGRIGERYSYIQARDGSMIEATGPINSVNEAVTAAEAALAGPQVEPVLYVNTMYLAGRRQEATLSGRMLEVVTRTAPVSSDDTPLYAAPATPARAEPTDAEIDMTIRTHGTGGWQTLEDMRRFARAVLALRGAA